MIVLGVDPALRHTGFGVVQSEGSRWRSLHHEVLKLSPALPGNGCLKRIGEHFLGLVDRFAPDEVAVEKVFVGKDPQGAFVIGQVKGVVLYLAEVRGLAVAEYAPATVKMSVVGYGRADKEQVGFMVGRLLGCGGDGLGHDEADALAIAMCHIMHAKVTGA